MEATPPRDNLSVMDISHAVDLWLGELERKDHSPRTIATYRRLLDKLADAYPLVDVEEITTTQLRRFLDVQGRLQKGGGRKARGTVKQNVSIVRTFFAWLTGEVFMPRSPADRIEYPRMQSAVDNDTVVTVSGADVVRLIEEADRGGRWNERLAVNVAAYLGPRRGAISKLKVSDWDLDTSSLRFFEKGSKTIRKPVPDRLARLLADALAAGVYETGDDYLVPGRGPRKGSKPDRDGRVIWHLVKGVAARAGVTTHVHALRSAFAVQFIESNPDGLIALNKLLGHSRLETTMGYLRRLDRQQKMETVRDLAWGEASPVETFVSRLAADLAANPQDEVLAILMEAARELGLDDAGSGRAPLGDGAPGAVTPAAPSARPDSPGKVME